MTADRTPEPDPTERNDVTTPTPPDPTENTTTMWHGGWAKLAGDPPDVRYIVFCPDKKKRHEGTFPTREAAIEWADTAHACESVSRHSFWRSA